jgi:hypothetical protein
LKPEKQLDKRICRDRRKKPTTVLSPYALSGKRKQLRRALEARNGYYVDIYSHRAGYAFMALLTLCILDGYFSMHLISLGAQELNPLMRALLKYDSSAFLIFKIAISYMGLFYLLIHKNFSFFQTSIRVKHIILVLLAIYTLLIVYEIVLFQFI